MKIVAMIPARSGSKGLADKNIKKLLGRPLISYTIEAASQCSEINAVYLNSDSEKYLEVGKKFGAKSFLRSEALSTDTASMKSVLEDFHIKLTQKNEFFDAVIVLYPVYPLRNSNHLSKIIQAFKLRGGKKTLIGLKNPKTHPYLCYEKDENDNIHNVMNIDVNQYYRRQQYPLYFELTHWACVIPVDSISSLNSQLICSDSFGYIIPEDIPVVNIDTQIDFDFAEFLLGRNRGRP